MMYWFLAIGVVLTIVKKVSKLKNIAIDRKFLIFLLIPIIAISVSGCSDVEIVRTKDCAMNTQKYELESFCGAPVQKTNGYISGSSTLGRGNVEGEVTTHDEVWYWYYKEDGVAYYNSVPSNHCIKKFLSDDIAPYVEVIDLGIQIKKINHIDGTEDVSYQSQNWTTYIFYLPEELKGNFK